MQQLSVLYEQGKVFKNLSLSPLGIWPKYLLANDQSYDDAAARKLRRHSSIYAAITFSEQKLQTIDINKTGRGAAAKMGFSDITPARVSRDVLIKTFHPSNIGGDTDVHNMCRKLGPHVTTCGNRARENFINSNDVPLPRRPRMPPRPPPAPCQQ
ncbi:hypothetical protein JYU34_007528 [Plutella xylostella]|uniref:Uncharacterized protein n=1 Tax=Plutella xylostella TaxID=51655 RepID=A0ABQ7QQN8_PLUXY|nr:hypothetical protein JYU34_007528 [Plutella xylostella]